MNNPPAFDPRRFTGVAQQLAAQVPQDEACFRRAVNRAYYAVFLVAREHLGIGDRPDVHTEVIRTLRAQNAAWGNQLDQLRHYRRAADYELVPVDPTKRDWQQNWVAVDRLAVRLRPILEGVRPAPPRLGR